MDLVLGLKRSFTLEITIAKFDPDGVLSTIDIFRRGDLIGAVFLAYMCRSLEAEGFVRQSVSTGKGAYAACTGARGEFGFGAMIYRIAESPVRPAFYELKLSGYHFTQTKGMFPKKGLILQPTDSDREVWAELTQLIERFLHEANNT